MSGLLRLRRAWQNTAAIAGAAPLPFSVSYLGKASAAGGATVNFTNQPLGAVPDAGETRYIVVVASANIGTTVSVDSCVINGVTATLVKKNTAAAAACTIFIANVPTGTTGTISVTNNVNNNPADEAIAIYRMMNPSSATPDDSVAANNVSGVVTVSLNVLSGGVGIAGMMSKNTATITLTPSGLDATDYNLDLGSGEVHAGGRVTSAGTPVAVTFTSNDTTMTGMQGVAASWH